MNSSFLYHAFGVKEYHYCATAYKDSAIFLKLKTNVPKKMQMSPLWVQARHQVWRYPPRHPQPTHRQQADISVADRPALPVQGVREGGSGGYSVHPRQRQLHLPFLPLCT